MYIRVAKSAQEWGRVGDGAGWGDGPVSRVSGADPGGDGGGIYPPQYFRLLEKWSKTAKNSVISENFRLRRAVC